MSASAMVPEDARTHESKGPDGPSISLAQCLPPEARTQEAHDARMKRYREQHELNTNLAILKRREMLPPDATPPEKRYRREDPRSSVVVEIEDEASMGRPGPSSASQQAFADTPVLPPDVLALPASEDDVFANCLAVSFARAGFACELAAEGAAVAGATEEDGERPEELQEDEAREEESEDGERPEGPEEDEDPRDEEPRDDEAEAGGQQESEDGGEGAEGLRENSIVLAEASFEEESEEEQPVTISSGDEDEQLQDGGA